MLTVSIVIPTYNRRDLLARTLSALDAQDFPAGEYEVLMWSDLTPLLTCHPTRETYFYFDGHFRPRGHALVADEIRREWTDLVN